MIALLGQALPRVGPVPFAGVASRLFVPNGLAGGERRSEKDSGEHQENDPNARVVMREIEYRDDQEQDSGESVF
jgi:hypothetical protein